MTEQTLNLLTSLFGFLCSLPTACREKVKISKLINAEYSSYLEIFRHWKKWNTKLVKKKMAGLKQMINKQHLKFLLALIS